MIRKKRLNDKEFEFQFFSLKIAFSNIEIS